MTASRDELIEQGVQALKDARPGMGYGNGDVSVLVEAGWRPPPTGDVIEAAQDAIFDEFGDDYSFALAGRAARAVASAGLLATLDDDGCGWKQRYEELREERDELWRETLRATPVQQDTDPPELPVTYAAGYQKGECVRLVSPYLGETHETLAEAEEHARDEMEYLDVWLFEVRPIRALSGEVSDG